MNNFLVKTKDSTFHVSVDLADTMEIGGEGDIYKVETECFGECILKLYRDIEKAQRLHGKILYLMRQEPPKSSKNIMFCWPLGAIYDERENTFVGYLMPKAFDGSSDLSILSAYSLHSPIAELFPDDTAWHKGFELLTKRGLRNRCIILFNWARAIHIIHQTHCYLLGDIKPENIMVDPETGGVSVIDIDSCQVSLASGQLFFPRTAQTPNYRPPEVNSSNSEEPIDYRYDSFSFAVSAYEILTGTHPYSNVRLKPPYFGDPQYCTIASRIRHDLYIRGPKSDYLERIPQCDLHANLDRLPRFLRTLFDKAFIDRDSRPTMNEWECAFRQTLKLLKI